MIMDNRQLDKYIEKAIKIHGNKYDYSKSNAHSCKDKAIFICPIHGEFEQTWDNHVNGGSGCPKCAKCHKYTNEEWIEEASKKHNGKYDYSKTNYVKARDKVIVICHEKDEFGEEHGEFEIRAGNHIAGIGCPKCAKKYRPTTDEWIKKARKVHGDKYLYDKVSYNGSDKKVLITCPIHGDFWQEAASHLSGVGCPKCRGENNSMTKVTYDSFSDFFENIEKKVDRNIINVNGAIRYKDYMVLYIPLVPNKRGELNDRRRQYIKRGYKVIIVFEDEYLNHKDIVLSKIRHLFKIDEQPKIMARKCNIRTIGRNEAKNFLIKNHIQGFVNSSVYLGAYNNATLIAVMSFTIERGNEWTLTRFASDNHYVCCGVGGKLFKYFIRNYNFNVIKSFADKRWTYNTEKNLYLELGFSEEKNMPPEYRYFKNGEIIRHHKFNFRKQVLHRKYGLSMALTETEMVKKLGYNRIWDCGLIKYVYTKTN